MNEFRFMFYYALGGMTGKFAPGLMLPAAGVNQVRHNAILAHGLGNARATSANAPAARVGLAENATVFVPAD